MKTLLLFPVLLLVGHAEGAREAPTIAFASFAPLQMSVFTADGDGNHGEISVMRADASDVRSLTENQFEEGTPAWRPAR